MNCRLQGSIELNYWYLYCFSSLFPQTYYYAALNESEYFFAYSLADTDMVCIEHIEYMFVQITSSSASKTKARWNFTLCNFCYWTISLHIVMKTILFEYSISRCL